MCDYIAETHILSSDANTLLEQICRPIAALCHSVTAKGPERTLEFDDGRAIIRAVDNGLIFWIVAGNILTFFGIRTILETSLFKISHTVPEWIRLSPTGGASSGKNRRMVDLSRRR
ncbi:hypothetical protein QD460_26265 [Rhizobium jaguaris]|uniref:SMa0974 family conjugal transfer regulator n=1 Tax=Rhizobium jaguaris TaxID=1312183 RepID=UPI0039BFB4C2